MVLIYLFVLIGLAGSYELEAISTAGYLISSTAILVLLALEGKRTSRHKKAENRDGHLGKVD